MLLIQTFCFYQSGLSHEELSVAVEMLSAVAVLNEVLDTKDPQAVIEQLTDSPLGFTNMDQDNLNRYDGCRTDGCGLLKNKGIK